MNINGLRQVTTPVIPVHHGDDGHAITFSKTVGEQNKLFFGSATI
jgi:hypothetical protein